MVSLVPEPLGHGAWSWEAAQQAARGRGAQAELHSVTSRAVSLARPWDRPSAVTSGHGLLEINFYFEIPLDFQENCKDAQGVFKPVANPTEAGASGTWGPLGTAAVERAYYPFHRQKQCFSAGSEDWSALDLSRQEGSIPSYSHSVPSYPLGPLAPMPWLTCSRGQSKDRKGGSFAQQQGGT